MPSGVQLTFQVTGFVCEAYVVDYRHAPHLLELETDICEREAALTYFENFLNTLPVFKWEVRFLQQRYEMVGVK